MRDFSALPKDKTLTWPRTLKQLTYGDTTCRAGRVLAHQESQPEQIAPATNVKSDAELSVITRKDKCGATAKYAFILEYAQDVYTM